MGKPYNKDKIRRTTMTTKKKHRPVKPPLLRSRRIETLENRDDILDLKKSVKRLYLLSTINAISIILLGIGLIVRVGA
jgi:hypothetical protein